MVGFEQWVNHAYFIWKHWKPAETKFDELSIYLKDDVGQSNYTMRLDFQNAKVNEIYDPTGENLIL